MGLTAIQPTSVATRLFTTVVMIASVYLNLYVLSAGLAPVLRTEALQEKLEQKKNRLASVLAFYKVPWPLQKQVASSGTIPAPAHFSIASNTRQLLVHLPNALPYSRPKGTWGTTRKHPFCWVRRLALAEQPRVVGGGLPTAVRWSNVVR